jgi:hypothetical protein
MTDLYVEASAFQTFDGRANVGDNRHLEDYYAAFLRSYGMTCDTAGLRTGRKNDFLDMARRLAQQLVRSRPPIDVDLLLLAHDTPNALQPLTSVTASLVHELNVNGPGFAISEQGAAAPFIALSLVHKYAEQGKCRRALVFVLDQTTWPYASDAGEPRDDCGIVLMLSTESRTGVKLRKADTIYIDSDAGDVDHRIGNALAQSLAHHGGDKTYRIVADAALARRLAGHELASRMLVVEDRYMSAAPLLPLCGPADRKTSENFAVVHFAADGQLHFSLFECNACSDVACTERLQAIEGLSS